jgi:hypothetical protein
MKTTTTIKLDDQFTLQSDPHCWILTRKSFGETNPKTGKPTRSSAVSYHPDLKTALTQYLDLSSKPSSEVLDVLTRLSTAERNIEIALEEVKPPLDRWARVDELIRD